MEMLYTAQEVKRRAELFLEAFLARAGDDIATLLSDISEGVPGRTLTDDPAAWFDWLRSLWNARGYRVVHEISRGRGLVSFTNGMSSEVTVSTNLAPIWSGPIPAGATVSSGMTEIEGLELLRANIRSAVFDRGVSNLADLSKQFDALAWEG